jgi:hypothetical protein
MISEQCEKMRAVLRRAAPSDAHVFVQDHSRPHLGTCNRRAHAFTHGCAQIDLLTMFSALRAFDFGTSE